MERYIDIDGEKVAVSEDVYRAYKRPAWRERKRRITRRKKERSLDKFKDDGFDIPAEGASLDEIVADKLLLDMLMSALDELTAEERGLIDALFYEDRSEQAAADALNISQQAVNKRKRRILAKLRDIIGW